MSDTLAILAYIWIMLFVGIFVGQLTDTKLVKELFKSDYGLGNIGVLLTIFFVDFFFLPAVIGLYIYQAGDKR
jgi:hypothetical protein